MTAPDVLSAEAFNRLGHPEKLAAYATLLERYTALEADNADLQNQIDDMEESPFIQDRIRELAKARTAIYDGRHDEGRELLERTLSHLDSSWRCFA